jgi:hypothetical protein
MLDGPWFFYSEPKELRVDFGFKKFGLEVEASLEKIGDIPLAEKVNIVLERLISLLRMTKEYRGLSRMEMVLGMIEEGKARGDKEYNARAVSIMCGLAKIRGP